MAAREQQAPAGVRHRNGIPLRWLIVVLFGGLVLISVGGVLTMAVTANFANTYSLLEEQAQQLLADLEDEIREVMANAEYTVVGFQRLVDDREIDLSDDDAVRNALRIQLRSTHDIETLAVERRNRPPLILHRTPDGAVRQFADAVAPALPLSGTQRAIAARQPATAGSAVPRPVWLGPQVRNGVLFHDVALPLRVEDHAAGRITASLGGVSVNSLVATFGRNKRTTTFLLNSENRVIAYSADPTLLRGKTGVALDEMPDPAMRGFARGELMNEVDQAGGGNTPFRVHGVDAGSQKFIFLTRQIALISPQPYTLGVYFTEADVTVEMRRAARSGAAGTFALVIALVIAFFLARSISRPMDRIADAAGRFSELDLDGFSPIPASRIREIDTQASAFNTLHTGLAQFSRYVPQALVRRILETGPEATRPVEREITVMFADIADFTAMTEPMDAEAVVGLLNDVFAVISREVAAASGTIDKYLGDGVMAFWGAPEEDPQHALHAIEAAHRIRTALGPFNAERIKAGQPAIRFRIGLHTGRATVGAIGGADRINYTVIGHTVNIASRIEQLIKSLDCHGDICIAVSADCHDAAGRPSGFHGTGSHRIRGSSSPVDVLMLEPDTDTAKPG